MAYGSGVDTAADAWLMGDIGVGMMAAGFNIIGILILQKPATGRPQGLREAAEARPRPGLRPPRPLGITGATFWENYAEEKEKNRAPSRTEA